MTNIEINKMHKTTEFIANYFGVTPRRVRQLAQEGIIPAIKKDGSYYFDPPIAIKKYIEYLQERINISDSAFEEKEKQKIEAEIRIINTRADIAEMRLSDLLSKMHCAEDVEDLLYDLGSTIKNYLIKLPEDISQDIMNKKSCTAAEISELIENYTNNILENLSNYKYSCK
ncbi:MAG: helix-turn-helix domain-containing protein [Candidatus Gastranaerophilales bacterium]|nr:helix-turn-helix domain-containing protein [Candidatus Gastranaerophilales bacterium]